MTKEEQTPEVKIKLYDLTRMFVKAYQPKFYIQYSGDIEDLVSDFYLQFLTEKSRVKGKEESLLDKFNPAITTLPYLVKISVQRMLIDRSRKDKREMSLDEKFETLGDMVALKFNLTDEKQETVDDFEASAELKQRARLLFSQKPEREQKAIAQYYRSVRSVIQEQFRELLDFMVISPSGNHAALVVKETHEHYVDLDTSEHLRVFQVTDKSIQLLHGTQVVTYNKETGHARGKNSYQIAKESLQELLEVLGGETFKLKL
jgi:uncharacterized protein YggL (DUF469 family)